jgi:hypothetical protein
LNKLRRERNHVFPLVEGELVFLDLLRLKLLLSLLELLVVGALLHSKLLLLRLVNQSLDASPFPVNQWRMLLAPYAEFLGFDAETLPFVLREIIVYLRKIWEHRKPDEDTQDYYIARLRLYHDQIIAWSDPAVKAAQQREPDRQSAPAPFVPLASVNVAVKDSLDRGRPRTKFSTVLRHLSENRKQTFVCANKLGSTASFHPYFFYAPGRKKYCCEECREIMKNPLNAKRQKDLRQRRAAAKELARKGGKSVSK